MMSSKRSFSFRHPISSSRVIDAPKKVTQGFMELKRLYEAQVIRAPQSPCLIDSANMEYSFVEIYNKAKRLALWIHKLNRSLHVIGITMNEHSAAEIVAVLGCMLSAVTFIPLPPPTSEGNRSSIEETLKILTNQSPSLISIIISSKEDTFIDECVVAYKGLLSIKMFQNGDVSTDTMLDKGDFNMLDKQLIDIHPLLELDVLYIMRTSGTTSGVPKFVKGMCDSTINRLNWQWETFPFNHKSVVARRSPLVFVDSIAEILGTILGGACLAIPSSPVTVSPTMFLESCRQLRVTRISLVPAILEVILKSIEQGATKTADGMKPSLSQALPELVEWIVSGEAVTPQLLQQFLRAASCSSTPKHSCFIPIKTYGEIRLVNLYGSTEVAGDVTYAILAQPEAMSGVHLNKKQRPDRQAQQDEGHCCGDYIPVGIPINGVTVTIDNTVAQTLDDDLIQSSMGGEIIVQGIGVSKGYVETSEEISRLNQSVFHSENKEMHRCFRTGDVGFICRLCGQVCLIGRKDNQVKVNGIRVSLEEIEAAITSIAVELGLNARIVIIHEQRSQGARDRLVAIVCSSDSPRSDVRHKLFKLLKAAQARLPAHFIPSAQFTIQSLPLTNSGKVNRGLLRQYLQQGSDNLKLLLPKCAPTTSSVESDPIYWLCKFWIVQDIMFLLYRERTNYINWDKLHAYGSETLSHNTDDSGGEDEEFVLSLLSDPDITFKDIGGDSMNAVELCGRLYQLVPKIISHLKQGDVEELAPMVEYTRDVDELIPSKVLSLSIHALSHQVLCIVHKVTKQVHVETCPNEDSEPLGRLEKGQFNKVSIEATLTTQDMQWKETSWVTRSGLRSLDVGTIKLPACCIPVSHETPLSGSLSIRWKVNLGKCVDASALILSTSSQGNQKNISLIISSHSRQVVKLDACSGKVEWQREVMTLEKAISDDASIEATAAVSNDGSLVFISGYDGMLRALSMSTGQEVWSVHVEAEIKGSPVVYPTSIPESLYHQTVFFGAHDNKLRCVKMLPPNFGSAHVMWSIELDGAVYASPVLVKTNPSNHPSEPLELIVVATTRGSLYAFELKHDRAYLEVDRTPAQPALLWRVRAPGPIFGTPACCGMRQVILYASVNGSVCCLDLLTGNNLWTRLSTRGYFSSPTMYPLPASNYHGSAETVEPVVEGSLMVIGCHDGHLSCREVKTGTRKWNLDLSSKTSPEDVLFSSPFFFKAEMSKFESTLYVAAATQLGLIVIVDVGSGEVVASLQLPGQIFSSPVVIETENTGGSGTDRNHFVMYVGCRDDNVYALDILL